MSEALNKFFETTRDKPPHRRTVVALELLSKERQLKGLQALDFGCGAGRDARYMLSQGMQVTAVDADTSGIVMALQQFPELEIVESTFDQFPFGSYDFVASQWALSFCPPETFAEMFAKLLNSIRSGGMLTCNIFGPNDEWQNDPRKTFLNEEAIRTLIGHELNIVELSEVEVDSHIADGTPKHWHYFDLLLKKP